MKNNLRRLDTCANCKFMLPDSDYDTGISYYCNLSNEITITNFYLPKTNKQKIITSTWKSNHEVAAQFICDDWEKGNDE